jgi:hypothetical protein
MPGFCRITVSSVMAAAALAAALVAEVLPRLLSLLRRRGDLLRLRLECRRRRLLPPRLLDLLRERLRRFSRSLLLSRTLLLLL